MIFDRSGELIWKTIDYNLSWDNLFKGKDVQVGEYTWKINY
jgi:hypothetical protein